MFERFYSKYYCDRNISLCRLNYCTSYSFGSEISPPTNSLIFFLSLQLIDVGFTSSWASWRCVQLFLYIYKEFAIAFGQINCTACNNFTISFSFG